MLTTEQAIEALNKRIASIDEQLSGNGHVPMSSGTTLRATRAKLIEQRNSLQAAVMAADEETGEDEE